MHQGQHQLQQQYKDDEDDIAAAVPDDEELVVGNNATASTTNGIKSIASVKMKQAGNLMMSSRRPQQQIIQQSSTTKTTTSRGRQSAALLNPLMAGATANSTGLQNQMTQSYNHLRETTTAGQYNQNQAAAVAAAAANINTNNSSSFNGNSSGGGGQYVVGRTSQNNPPIPHRGGTTLLGLQMSSHFGGSSSGNNSCLPDKKNTGKRPSPQITNEDRHQDEVIGHHRKQPPHQQLFANISPLALNQHKGGSIGVPTATIAANNQQMPSTRTNKNQQSTLDLQQASGGLGLTMSQQTMVNGDNTILHAADLSLKFAGAGSLIQNSQNQQQSNNQTSNNVGNTVSLNQDLKSLALQIDTTSTPKDNQNGVNSGIIAASSGIHQAVIKQSYIEEENSCQVVVGTQAGIITQQQEEPSEILNEINSSSFLKQSKSDTNQHHYHQRHNNGQQQSSTTLSAFNQDFCQQATIPKTHQNNQQKVESTTTVTLQHQIQNQSSNIQSRSSNLLNLLASTKPTSASIAAINNRTRMSRSNHKPKWKDLEQTTTYQQQRSLKQATSLLTNSQYPLALIAASGCSQSTNNLQLNTNSYFQHGRQTVLQQSSDVHKRLFEEHAAHQKRRLSIYDPERKDKEIELNQCTFQPCLDKTQYSRRTGGLQMAANQRDSITSACYGAHMMAANEAGREVVQEDGGCFVVNKLDEEQNTYQQQSSMKKRCRSQPRNQTIQNFAVASTLSGITCRSREKFYADMTQYKERREQKVNRMRQTLNREQTMRAKEYFDTISKKSQRSFSLVSKKSLKEIRSQLHVRQIQRRKSIIDEITPSFKPTFFVNDRLLQRRASVGSIFCQTQRCVSPMVATTTSSHIMLQGWRDKSALQRFADDLEQRKLNLKQKMQQKDCKIQQLKGETFRAIDKSDDYLLRHFFAELTNICQQIFFPSLLNPPLHAQAAAISLKEEPNTVVQTSLQQKEETTFAEQESGSCAGIIFDEDDKNQKSHLPSIKQIIELLRTNLDQKMVSAEIIKVLLQQTGFISSYQDRMTKQEIAEVDQFLIQILPVPHDGNTSSPDKDLMNQHLVPLNQLYIALCMVQKFNCQVITSAMMNTTCAQKLHKIVAKGSVNWDFPALLNHRKTYLTTIKRSVISKKINLEIKSKNPLKPAITKKSITLSNNARVGEFRRNSQISQKAYCQILHQHSQKKEDKRESIRKQSQEIEVVECSFKPKTNLEKNKKIGFTKFRKSSQHALPTHQTLVEANNHNSEMMICSGAGQIAGTQTVAMESTTSWVPTQRERTRKKKLYEQGKKVKVDRAQDQVEFERDAGQFTFMPNSTLSSASLRCSKKVGGGTPSNVASFKSSFMVTSSNGLQQPKKLAPNNQQQATGHHSALKTNTKLVNCRSNKTISQSSMTPNHSNSIINGCSATSTLPRKSLPQNKMKIMTKQITVSSSSNKNLLTGAILPKQIHQQPNQYQQLHKKQQQPAKLSAENEEPPCFFDQKQASQEQKQSTSKMPLLNTAAAALENKDTDIDDDYDEDENEVERVDQQIVDETRPLQKTREQLSNMKLNIAATQGNQQVSLPTYAPMILRLDIKVAENQTKQLVIDRTIEDPWQKALVFCESNGLSSQQAQKLNKVISMNIIPAVTNEQQKY